MPRSLRGSLPAYTWASVGLVLALALAGLTWWLDDPDLPRVLLRASSIWQQATLDDGFGLRVLVPGEGVDVPPGTYRVTLLADSGRSERHTVRIREGLTLVGE